MVKRKLTPEQIASEDVEITAPSLGVTLLRNNNGAFYDKDGRLVRFGAGHVSGKEKFKSGDYIGWTRVVITPEMVGKTVSIFTNAEVKPEKFVIREVYKPGSREEKQEHFNNLVRSNGGFGMIVRSGEELKHCIEHFIKWLKS